VAGYSKRLLVEKLGIKAGQAVLLLNVPENYFETLGPLPQNSTPGSLKPPRGGALDFIQFFTTQRAELEKHFPDLKKSLAPNGALWISWPKGSSKVSTDLNENIVREIGLKNHLVDVKVCAVDEVWSGLKFVYRRQDRK
jgi:hypothetical protein